LKLEMNFKSSDRNGQEEGQTLLDLMLKGGEVEVEVSTNWDHQV